jgi:hypothetical protein
MEAGPYLRARSNEQSGTQRTIHKPQGLDRRWTKSATGEAKENAEYALSFAPGYDWREQSHAAFPVQHLSFTLRKRIPTGWTHAWAVIWSRRVRTVTQVRFYHKGWPADNEHWRVSCYCWAMYLRVLRRYLEHGEFVPYEKRLEV